MPAPRRNTPEPVENAPETPVSTPETLVSAELAELDLEDVGFEAPGGRQLHPQIVAAIQRSWDQKIEKGNRIETPTSRLVCRTETEAKERVRQIRDAGAHLKIGVGVKGPENVNGTWVVRFRARKRRGTSDASA